MSVLDQTTEVRAPYEPPLDERSTASDGRPIAFAIVGAAFLAGVLLAKWLDWRGHAHPRG
jgi:hypothetical protein